MKALRESKFSERIVSWLFLISGLVWFVYRFWLLSSLHEHGDESIHIVAAWMIGNGDRLYQDVFSHHGPFPGILSWFVYVITGSHEIPLHRIPVAVLYLIAAGLIHWSPLFDRPRSRGMASGVFLLVTGTVSATWSGQMLIYSVVAGPLAATLILNFVLPALLRRHIRAWQGCAAGVAAAWLFLCAYSYVLALAAFGCLILWLWMSARRRGAFPIPLRSFLAGAAVGIAVQAGWLAMWGSLSGYAAYHLYFNQAIYSRYIAFDPTDAVLQGIHILDPAMWSGGKYRRFHFLSLALLLGAGAFLAVRGLTSSARKPTVLASVETGALWIVLGLGIVYLNPRADLYWRAAAFYAACWGIPPVLAIAFLEQAETRANRWACALALAIVLISTVAWYNSGVASSSRTRLGNENIRAARGFDRQRDSDIVRIVQAVTTPNERILAFTYTPWIYLFSGRLPASGNFYYLPWQADYGRHPVLGKNIDTCAELAISRPPVIVLDYWKVWDRYPFQDYAPCIVQFVRTGYAELTSTSSHVYVRDDVEQAHATALSMLGFPAAKRIRASN